MAVMIPIGYKNGYMVDPTFKGPGGSTRFWRGRRAARWPETVCRDAAAQDAMPGGAAWPWPATRGSRWHSCRESEEADGVWRWPWGSTPCARPSRRLAWRGGGGATPGGAPGWMGRMRAPQGANGGQRGAWEGSVMVECQLAD